MSSCTVCHHDHDRSPPTAECREVNRVTKLLMDTWAKHEPDHSITQHPQSYIATFVDMARAVVADRAFRAKAIYPPRCAECKGTGVIVTGNNDLPCDCEYGAHALFNTERGVETGAEIKARRR